MKFHPTELEGAYLIDIEARGDARGSFARTFCDQEFGEHGLETRFVQQNMSISAIKGTLRGMHRQVAPHEEVKIVRCLRGAIWDCIVDLRPDSPTYCNWQGFELSDDNQRQLYVPRGFAHGFFTLTDAVEVSYLVSAHYAPDAEAGVRYNDPAFGINWPGAPVIISDKDKNWPDFER